MTSIRHVGPSHHARAFKPVALKDITEQTLKVLTMLKSRFPNLAAVAGTGHSGTLVVGAVSVVTDFFPILVRKEGERGIIPNNPEISGAVGDFDYVIIDDLVSSGTTVNRIQEKIESEFRKEKIMEVKRYETAKADLATYGAEKFWDWETINNPPVLTVPPRCIAVLVYDGGNYWVPHLTGNNGTGLPVLNVAQPLGDPSWKTATHAELMARVPVVREVRERDIAIAI